MPGAERPAGMRAAALLAAAGLGLVGYTYLTPPLLDPGLPARLPVIGALPGDLPLYCWRFLASFVLLGVLPLAAALALGERPAGLGLVRPARVRPRWLLPLLLGVLILGALSGAYNPAIYAYYPYSRTLTEGAFSGAGGTGGFLLHALCYLLFYYLPWEVLFRGILIFPLVRLAAAGGAAADGAAADGAAAGGAAAGPGAIDERVDKARGRASGAGAGGVLGGADGWPPAALLAVACLQALPSTMLHFGHPWAETLVALPFGLVLGWLALASGSLLPGLALHAATGLFLDLFILLRRVGGLP